MKFLYKICFLSAMSLLASCSTTNEPVDPALIAQANQSNNSNPGSNPISAVGDYWPTALNNQWIYRENGVLQPANKIISINQINGLTYYTFNSAPGASSTGGTQGPVARLRKTSGDYFFKIEDFVQTTPFGSVTQTGYEFIILKDYLSVGQTWTGSYVQNTTFNVPGIPPILTSTAYTGTIIEKGVSLQVGGVTFTDVIKVRYQDVVSIAGVPSPDDNIDAFYWFAKNKGLIRYDDVVTVNGTTTTTTSTLDSFILN